MLIKEFFRIQKYKSGPKSINPSCTKGGGEGGLDDPTNGFLKITLLRMNQN